jgi:hypothetical protein
MEGRNRKLNKTAQMVEKSRLALTLEPTTISGLSRFWLDF